MDIRAVVTERMGSLWDIREGYARRQKIKPFTATKLAKLSGVARQTVYDFLGGATINSDALGKLLDALGMQIVPIPQPTRVEPPPATPQAPLMPQANGLLPKPIKKTETPPA